MFGSGIQEIIFSMNMTKSSHSQIFFNSVPVFRASFQKHLVIYQDDKLKFNCHI